MLCYTRLCYSRPCYAMLTLPCISRGGAGLPSGPLVVPWRLQAGLPHHQRLTGPQHDAAPLHRLALPSRDGVPLPQGGLRPGWCVSLHQAAATFNVVETSPGRRSADLQKLGKFCKRLQTESGSLVEVWISEAFHQSSVFISACLNEDQRKRSERLSGSHQFNCPFCLLPIKLLHLHS